MMDVSFVTLNTHFEGDLSLFEQAIEKLLREFETEQELTIIFTDDDHIHQLNRDYRQKDMPTDVLSFEMHDDIHPISPLGEIYISLDRATIQAQEHNQTVQEEVLHLAIHGTLHLLGFEHDTEEGYAQMQQKENEYLSYFQPKLKGA